MTSRSLRAKVAAVACLLTATPAFPQQETDAVDEEEVPEDVPVDAPEEEPIDEEEMDEALSEEDAALLAESEVSPSKPIERGKGAVFGVVRDTKYNEPVIEGSVSVVGTKVSTLTDLEGRYRLELPPGTYTLRFSYELHRSTRIEGVVVTEGKMVRADAQLTPDESAVDVVEVVADVDRSSLEGQTLKRQRDASVGDGVGRAEIARTPDRNAAEAARRVVGASVVGGRFVYVRGLGERYTNASLNGAPLPSPEPDRNTVPLDLFPALIIDSITIAKTFSPDMPADFAGGSVRIFTRQFPRETLFQLGISGGYDTATTFRDGHDYPGSGTDFLGFDGGKRSLPDSVPGYKVSEGYEVSPGVEVTEEETLAVGRDVNSTMSTTDELMPPNYGLSLVAGDGFKIGKSQKLGLIGALNYSRTFETRRDEIVRIFRNPGVAETGLVPIADLRANTTTDKVRWGAFGTVAYEFSPQHTLSLTGIHSQSADDDATELEGDYSGTQTGRYHATKLSYVSRGLDVLQLRGDHEFEALSKGRLEWYLSLSRALRDQPDTRNNLYLKNDQVTPTIWSWQVNAQSGSHFFSDQEEHSQGGGLDWTQPVGTKDNAPKLKLGGRVTTREREFDARRFEFSKARGVSEEDEALYVCAADQYPRNCSDKLFLVPNIGPVLAFEEKTRANDSYTAGLDVYAAYVMADAQLVKDVRLIVGPRVEITHQFIRAVDPFSSTAPPEEFRIEETDVLPSAQLVYSATKKVNARFGATRTLARPQLRELSPFSFAPYFGGYPMQGNPELDLTYITNLDTRFEYFPTLREVLAFSVFYKHFVDPIEEVLRVRTETPYVSFANAAGADLIGVELEARKSLGFAHQSLQMFSLMANLTLAHSRVQLDDQGIATNASRPLSNMSPYILNFAIDYADQENRWLARLLYNVHGARLATVGLDGLQDIYERPRHLLDLTVAKGFGEHFELKGTAQNLLFAPVRFTQEGPDGKQNVTNEWRPGATLTISAAYTH